MANLQEIVDRAEQLAIGTRGDGFQSALIDSGYTSETIFPHAVRHYIRKMIETGEDLSEFLQLHTITITAGSGTIPAAIIKDHLKKAVFPGRPFVSWLPYSDYLRYRFNPQLTYFTYLNSTLFFKEPSTLSFSGDVDVQAPSLPTLPTLITDPVPLSLKTTEGVIVTIASVLLGEIKLTQLLGEKFA